MRNKAPIITIIILVGATTFTSKAETIVYFSPEDNIQEHLINRLNKAQEKIYAAIYMLTSQELCKALCNARMRNVDVQIISDESCATSRFGKIEPLKKAGIDVFIHKRPAPKHAYDEPLMHHKFAIIDHAVWTGSYNWTRAANASNKENVIITDDHDAVHRYCNHFEQLKRTCCAVPTTKRVAHRTVSKEDETNYMTKKIMNFLRVLAKKLIGQDS